MKSIIITFISLIALIMASCSKEEEAPKRDFYQEIKSEQKMVFASMAITKTAKSQRTDWYKIGKRIAVYSYDSYMRAYIDLSELQEEDIVVDELNKSIKITLPSIKTDLIGRDMPLRKEYENIGLLRTELDSKDRAEMKEKANASLKREVEKNPVFRQQLTESAKRKARAYFETLFQADGYTTEVEFKN